MGKTESRDVRVTLENLVSVVILVLQALPPYPVIAQTLSEKLEMLVKMV